MRDLWNQQLKLATLICVADAAESGSVSTLHVPAPGPEPVDEVLLHVSFEVEREMSQYPAMPDDDPPDDALPDDAMPDDDPQCRFSTPIRKRRASFCTRTPLAG